MPNEATDALNFILSNWKQIGLFSLGFIGAPKAALEFSTDALLGIPARAFSIFSTLPDNKGARIISHILLRTGNGYLFAALGSKAFSNEAGILLHNYQGLRDLAEKVPNNFIGQFNLPDLANIQGNPIETVTKAGEEINKVLNKVKDPFITAWLAIYGIRTGAQVLHGFLNFHLKLPALNLNLGIFTTGSEAKTKVVPPTFSREELIKSGDEFLHQMESTAGFSDQLITRSLIDWLTKKRLEELGSGPDNFVDFNAEDYEILRKILGQRLQKNDRGILNNLIAHAHKDYIDSIRLAHTQNPITAESVTQDSPEPVKISAQPPSAVNKPERKEKTRQSNKLHRKPSVMEEGLDDQLAPLPPVDYHFTEDLNNAIALLTQIITTDKSDFHHKIAAIKSDIEHDIIKFMLVEQALKQIYLKYPKTGNAFYSQLKNYFKKYPDKYWNSKTLEELIRK